MSNPGPSAAEIVLSDDERAELVRRAGLPGRRRADRARIILATAGPAFGLTKRQLQQRFLARVQDLAVFDAEVDAIWKAPATPERIRAFMTSLK